MKGQGEDEEKKMERFENRKSVEREQRERHHVAMKAPKRVRKGSSSY